MKYFILILYALLLGIGVFAQNVYTIKADSVKITNCDSAEFILENHTQNVPGFLYNTGNGRTIFKRALVKVNDSIFLLGGDTLHTGGYSYWQGNYPHIYNTNPGNVGIKRTAPAVLLDLPGPVNIDDSSAYRIGYRPVLRVATGIGTYRDTFVGDSSGTYSGNGYNETFVGGGAGTNNMGADGIFVGYLAGHDNQGDWNVFIGDYSGQNNGEGGAAYCCNSFLGSLTGANGTGAANTLLGFSSGATSIGAGNSEVGYYTGVYAVGDNNCFIGGNSGHISYGSFNVFVGDSSGVRNAGSGNVFVGSFTGLSDTLHYVGEADNVTLLGDSADISAPSHYISNATAIGHKAVVSASNTMVFGDTNVNSWLFNSGATAAPGAAMVIGSNSSNGNGAYLTTGGVWTNASDRNKKEHFESLNGSELLDKIALLPVMSWNYKGLTDRHIGPVAQDFYRIFHVGNDDKTISTIDPSGIALVGVQELYRSWQRSMQQVNDQQSKISDQQSQIEELRSKLQKQESEMTAQQAQMARLLDKLGTLEMTVNTLNPETKKKEDYTKR